MTGPPVITFHTFPARRRLRVDVVVMPVFHCGLCGRVSTESACTCHVGKRAIEVVAYLEKAMRKLQADHPDTPVTWPDGKGGTHYQTIEDWVAWHLAEARDI